MKDPMDRTKVVMRHLPPAISEAALMEQIDASFSGRYKWVCFRPGKNRRINFTAILTDTQFSPIFHLHQQFTSPMAFTSLNHRNQRHARVYIDLKQCEDVVEFSDIFNGHIFVNEKGSQFKALVEYAPSQRIPKPGSKKDGREGTIFKDPEYLEFLEHLAKPVENLPSAEIQLERREAERAAGPKETLVVTPLMEFVRQKRAAKSGSQRASTNGKVNRRTGGASPNKSSLSYRRGLEKRRVPTPMYVLRDGTKNIIGKDKSPYILVPRKNEQLLVDKSVSVASASGAEPLENESVSGGIETGKRRIVLLKGKEKETSRASGVASQQQNVASVRNLPGLAALRQSQRNEASGRIIRGILSNKDQRHCQSNLAASLPEQQAQSVHSEKDKRPPRPPNTRPILKDIITGSQKQVGRRGLVHGPKEVDGPPNFSEGKLSKRGSAGYGSQERQVWVQKSSSGS